MTTGDKSAQQTSLPRAANRPAPDTSNGSGAKQGRVAVSKGTVKKRAPRTATPKGEAEVLERLNQLDAAPAEQTLAPMPIPLPAIIEADPSYPIPVPPTVAAVAKAPVAEQPAAPAPAPAPVDLADAPTQAVSTEAATADPSAPTQAFVPPLLLMPDVLPETPERTDTVPLIAPAPTEAMPATVIGDDIDGSFGLVLPQRPLQRPIAFRRGKPRVRRVTRVVRHVDPWSVFKVALVFNAILFIVCLTSGVLLWNVANATGTVDNVEKFFEQFGWSSFEFNGGALYHNAWIAGLFGALFLTGMAVFLATVFNLISDLVGGIRVSVLEEEVIARSVTYPGARGIGRLFDRSGVPDDDDADVEAEQPG